MTAFNCAIRETQDVFIASPSGYLDEDGGQAFRRIVKGSFQKGFKKFIINLSANPVINSLGITQILETFEEILYDQKGAIGIVALSEIYYDVFQVVGILRLVKLFSDEEEALKELK